MAFAKNHSKQLKTLTVLLTLILCFVLIPSVKGEIRSRGVNSVNTNFNKNKHETTTSNKNGGATSSSAATSESTSSHVNTDFMDKLSWKCANNASCLYSLASGILSSYRRGDTVKFGFLDLVKLPASTTHKTKFNLNSKSNAETGRSMSTFVDFISGNAIRIPVGPMVFSVQRAEDDDNYIEVALLKKARSSTARLGGGGDGSGLLGGGGGGGGGHGHGIIQRIKEHKESKNDDKKQMQMYIPMYLAATTFGWTMVAAKAVGLLTLKALAISKIAFIVAAMVLMKKLMENASEKMMYQYPEQSPYMMPYSMDYGMHSMAAAPPDMAAASDMYGGGGGGMPMHAAVASMQAAPGHPGYEHLAAESSVHQSIADIQNNTQVLAALNAAGLGAKVKREDSWLGRIILSLALLHMHICTCLEPLKRLSPTNAHLKLKQHLLEHKPKINLSMLKSYNDFITAAAIAAAEVVVEENEKRLQFKSDFFGEDIDEEEEEADDVFNGEESIKETLQFFANMARRPMVYNYLNPHASYYRQ
ncbi:osiris 4 [Cochliomyia hominivorax]